MSNCIFCKIAQHEIESNIVYEDDICLAFLDLSQTTYGHTLVVSKTHATNILDVDSTTLSHMAVVAQTLAKKIKTNLNAKGINILTNAELAAGQTVMHFHIHIIPRYDEKDGFDPKFTNHQDEYDLQQLKQKIQG